MSWSTENCTNIIHDIFVYDVIKGEGRTQPFADVLQNRCS